MASSNGNQNGAPPTNGALPQNNLGQIRPTDIVGEMQVAYLDYAMSVIVARALPDVRDGLKPVHRRILYAMYSDLGLTHDKPHKKSARVVGEVLGKYHPHGDVAVYDAMVRMAQPFSLRYPLVDGQGNFGSIDGDSAAAMRYTEARLAEISDLMLADLEKETVGWHDNFDSTLLEPDVLPAALPNLLINGSNGIAVGMATNVPPHNLNEIVDALTFLIDHFATIDEVTVEQLMGFVQGPDFPTGGIIYRYREEGKGEEQIDAIAQGYAVGKSRLIMQAKAHFEEMSRGRSRIVITELPYQTNKTTLIERIAELVRDGKIEGIADLRDESDRTGMRVMIELKRDVEPKGILADLFKYTPLQQTFGMQMLALVDGQPRMLSLKRALHLFIQHRQEIVRRRSEFDLKRARERAHIVEGLLKALDILDEVIATIRRSQTVETARKNLVADFKFTEIQAQAILDMQLRRLAALERKKLQEEFKELKERIAYLEDLLAHPEKILAVIKEELLQIKEKYGDVRRTQIVDRTKGALTTTDLIPEQEVWVAVGSHGEVRRQEVGRLNATTLRQLGKGSDVTVLSANTRDTLYLFTQDGRAAKLAIHELPVDNVAKAASDLTRLNPRDRLAAALTLPAASREQESRSYLFFVTEQGVVKRITLVDFLNAIVNVPTVMGVEEKDRLGWVFLTQGHQEVLLVTADGQAIRFSEDEVRSMGLPAGGVGGIKLKKGDKIVYASVVEPDGELITLTAQGYAKRSVLTDYPSQGRNGGGIVTHKPTDRTGNVVTALLVSQSGPNEILLPITRKGSGKPLVLSEIPAMGRGVQGKPVLEAIQGDALVKLLRVYGAGASGAAPASNSSTPTPAAKEPTARPTAPALTTPVAQSKPAAVSAQPTPIQSIGKSAAASPPTNGHAATTEVKRPTNGASEKPSARVTAVPPQPAPTAQKVNPPVGNAAASPAKANPGVGQPSKSATLPTAAPGQAAPIPPRQNATPPAASAPAVSGRGQPPPAPSTKTSAPAQTLPPGPTATAPIPPAPSKGQMAVTSSAKASESPRPQAQRPAAPTPAPKTPDKSGHDKTAPPPLQASLFGVDLTPQGGQNPKAKKVQTVMSVPANQANKGKQSK